MTLDTRQFWIDVEPDNPETAERLNETLGICHETYLWAMDTITATWINEKHIPKVGNLSKNLTELVKSEPQYKKVQRYTLNRVIEEVISKFNQELEIGSNGRVKFPEAPKKNQLNTLQIPVRGIWKKYLEESSRVSTAYGSLYMTGDWKDLLKMQAKYNSLSMRQMPYFWHSLTIKEEGELWQIQFNLHNIESHQGKISQKKMEREGFKAL